MCELLVNLIILLGGSLVAIFTLLQSFGVGLLSGESELQEIQNLMSKGKTQSDADKIVKDRNSRITRIYSCFIFIGAIIMAIGGFYK
jgi:hypothetical protein